MQRRIRTWGHGNLSENSTCGGVIERVRVGRGIIFFLFLSLLHTRSYIATRGDLPRELEVGLIKLSFGGLSVRPDRTKFDSGFPQFHGDSGILSKHIGRQMFGTYSTFSLYIRKRSMF